MSEEKNQLKYCRRRGRDNPNCAIKTYSKNAVCAVCREELEQLAEDMAYIKELGIVPIVEPVEHV